MRIGGVVLNRVGSERHVRLVADAIAALDIPVLGAIPRDASLALPERHLGLVQAGEHANLAARLEHLADMAEHHLDLDAIKQLAVPPHRSAARLDAPAAAAGPAHRAGARRRLQLRLSACAGRLAAARAPRSCPSRRSPTRPRRRTATVAGFPAAIPSFTPGALAAADRFRAGVTRFAATRPVHGECGGYMVLGESLEDADGVSHRMLGLLGHATSFAHRKLHLGYRQARLLADSPLGKAGRRSCAGTNSTMPP